MTKRSFNLRKVIVMTICFTVTAMFSGCNKDDKELPKNPLTYEEGVVINGVKWATRNDGSLNNAGSTGNYNSSAQRDNEISYSLTFSEGNTNEQRISYRSNGCSLRCVAE